MNRTKASALGGLEPLGVLPVTPLTGKQLPITPAAFTDYRGQAPTIEYCVVDI